jgi:pyruvate kinase
MVTASRAPDAATHGRVRGSSSASSQSGAPLERRTKILATLGPATDAPGVLDALVAAGLDCARLNCSHGTSAELLRRAIDVRAAAARAGRPLGLLFDLQGPKLRLTADTVERAVVPGDVIVLTGSEHAAASDRAVVDFEAFSSLVTERSEIVIGDGVPRLAVQRTDNGDVVARAVFGGALGPRKGVSVTYARPDLPTITPKDVADLAHAARMDADFVALSFVRTGADLKELRDRLRAHGSRAGVVAKIETVEAYDNLDEIIEAADGILIARGDYGVTAGLASVPVMQKDTIRRAKAAGKLVITATQMLESMITNAEPTRAEVADVANAVIDGTSALMLSAETSVGVHPVAAVDAMSVIADAAEQMLDGGPERRTFHAGPPAAVMHAAVQLADDVGAAAIVLPTATGRAARACARYRPRQPIIALTNDHVVARQLTLEWGVYPVVADLPESLDQLVCAALRVGCDFAGLGSGDRVVVTAGKRAGAQGPTDVIVERTLP